MASSADFKSQLDHQGTDDVSSPDQGCLAELVMTHTAAGQYLSCYWPKAAGYGVVIDELIGQDLSTTLFRPIDAIAYLEQVRHVVTEKTPRQIHCQFRSGTHVVMFDLTISPILQPKLEPTTVIVLGHLTTSCPADSTTVAHKPAIASALPTGSDRYPKLLTRIAWNIRRTLDLPTIWQQTVEGLGQALGVSRCVVCPYTSNDNTVKIVAEYRSQSLPVLLGAEARIADTPALQQAIHTLQPVSLDSFHIEQKTNPIPDKQTTEVEADLAPAASSAQACTTTSISATTPEQGIFDHQWCSALIIPTAYHEQLNGLIILYQSDRPRCWTDSELEFIHELVDQVGTAIAHANLIAASQALAAELQSANSRLLQKHRELEEASRQAEEASRLKSEFLANTSHEIRTPLNGMIGFLKLIMDGMVDDPVEQTEFIQEAYSSALHLLNILDDILDLAKIEAGRLQIDLGPVKLNDLLEALKSRTRSQVLEKKLNFEVQKLPTDDEILLYGDYQRLFQVMLNLVGNAIKFTHEGGITVSVEILKKKLSFQNQEFPGLVRVRVADTGIGVSLDKQDKLFQSFSQVDGSRTRQYGGTGLGLAISQKLIEAMGGDVNFYSMGEGLGSTVTFTVPLYQEPVMITDIRP